MTDDGVRPAPLEEGRPQGKLLAACRLGVRNRPESRCSCAADGGTVAERPSILPHALASGEVRAGFGL